MTIWMTQAHRLRWKGSIKRDLRKVECDLCLGFMWLFIGCVLAAVENAVINIWLSCKAENF